MERRYDAQVDSEVKPRTLKLFSPQQFPLAIKPEGLAHPAYPSINLQHRPVDLQ